MFSGDKVHIIGMLPRECSYLTFDSVMTEDGKEIKIEPPVVVAIEGESAAFNIIQGALAVRYDNSELQEVGDGNTVRGMHRVLGSVAEHGKLVIDEIKPLHPSLVDGQIIPPPALSA